MLKKGHKTVRGKEGNVCS